MSVDEYTDEQCLADRDYWYQFKPDDSWHLYGFSYRQSATFYQTDDNGNHSRSVELNPTVLKFFGRGEA